MPENVFVLGPAGVDLCERRLALAEWVTSVAGPVGLGEEQARKLSWRIGSLLDRATD
jgi:hypothetical protein